jgi:hypothetical protein
MPEEIGNLLEGHALGQVSDYISPVDEPAVLAIDHTDFGLDGDNTLKTGTEVRHAEDSLTGSSDLP